MVDRIDRLVPKYFFGFGAGKDIVQACIEGGGGEHSELAYGIGCESMGYDSLKALEAMGHDSNEYIGHSVDSKCGKKRFDRVVKAL